MRRRPPKFDAVFGALDSRRRRQLLAVLKTSDRRLTIHDLTQELAVRESERAITDVPGEDAREIFVSLRHVHVPKLAALEFVTYDRERGTVEPTDRFGSLEPHLSAAIDAEFDSSPQPDDAGRR